MGRESSIIYKSIRVGQYGKLFTILKFRTMCPGADRLGPQSTRADDPRITPLGKFLRRHKIDELPQLWNVLKGDMSIVGPRPTTPEVIHTLTRKEKDVILSVKPGLTDLASLYDINEEERLKGSKDPHAKFMKEIYPEIKRLQIYYVNHRSFRLNLKIIWQTIRKLLLRRA